ncbi:MAG TPA: formimidoylglutamate deiminase [Chryseosolibacter sp.]|nr:formimidoylglutamate deiminase [Chryseosolibacter sp.]
MNLPNETHRCVRFFEFDAVCMRDSLISPCVIGVDDNGIIRYLSKEMPLEKLPLEKVHGVLLPGFQNAHSHAFQYAMAGMAEIHPEGGSDDFWSWREAMYQCALSLNPDQIQAVATTLYVEMLKRGYTHVAEFHYLHHDTNGKPYANICETSVALIAAAAEAGIKITIVPVFYQKGGFGKEAQSRQKRFIFQSRDQYFKLLEETRKVADKITTARVGYGVHSLRAADAEDVIEIEKNGPRDIPFHIHAAEQLKEVEDSVAYLKQRPLEWLLSNLPLSERFSIVHCTHLTDDEVVRLAKSKANVVLCPGTEGNLGDGIFRLTDFSQEQGNWCIGTDSHISLNPMEDLRWLDYAQRLVTHRRNTFNDGGFHMVGKAFSCGQTAMGFQTNKFFEVGQPLDGVVYGTKHALLSDLNPSYTLSRILYNSDPSWITGTLVNGQWIIRDGFHKEDQRLREQFGDALRAINIG